MIYWITFLIIAYSLIYLYDADNRHRGFILFLFIFVLIYFSAFRDGLGMDYTAYRNYCEYERVYSMDWLMMEPFPAALYKFCYDTTFSAIIFFLITSIITCTLCIWVYSRYKNFWISAFLFVTYTNLYFASFNIVRQFTASSIILLGAHLFIFRKKNPWFFAFVILAFLWHKSSILCVFIYFLSEKNVNIKFWLIAIIASWVLPFNFLFNIPVVSQWIEVFNYSDNINHVVNAYSRTSASNLYMHVMIIFFLLNWKRVERIKDASFIIPFKIFIISVMCCNISANSIGFMYRYAMFLSPFIPIAFSYIPKIADRDLAKLLVCVPIFMLLMIVLLLNMGDRTICPQKILPVESIYDKNYHPYDNPKTIQIQ